MGRHGVTLICSTQCRVTFFYYAMQGSFPYFTMQGSTIVYFVLLHFVLGRVPADFFFAGARLAVRLD